MVDVSVIIPVYNAEKWLDECLQSVYDQQFTGKLEISIFNDSSQDKSPTIIEEWRKKFEDKGWAVKLGHNTKTSPGGVGFAKNEAVRQSCGQYLCFLDSDDVMLPRRIEKQHLAAQGLPKAIIGCKFYRTPVNSTERYSNWANGLSQDQLLTQVYTSHGPTVIMPTWFCSRDVYNKVGGFDESGKGTPEDLLFFYKHLDLGGDVHRVDDCLMMYRYHPDATTFSINRQTIWNLRVAQLQEQVLTKWGHFTIWNAGKQGRKLYRSLSKINRDKVAMFCDVDKKKIKKGVYKYEESKEKLKPTVPIVHFTQLKPPVIICMKLDLTDGVFEKNLASMNLIEGVDYFHFN